MPELSGIADLGWLHTELFGRLALAALLGGMIGLEREWSGKPAGFRTNLLICLGAALVTELSLEVAALGNPAGTADPGRIAAQIVSGIGFLGAGTIIQSRGSVIGLTTAATLWVVAAIGMAVGAGAYGDAVVATALVIVALLVLAQIEPALRRREEHVVQITAALGTDVVPRVESTLAGSFEYHLSEAERGEHHLTLEYRVIGPGRNAAALVQRLLEIEGVERVARR